LDADRSGDKPGHGNNRGRRRRKENALALRCNRAEAISVRSIMKLTLLLIFSSAAVFAQPISFGVNGGLPLTDFLDTVSGSRATVTTITNRYIVGPTVELRLPFGFGVEVDALYRHFSYNSTASLIDVLSTLRTTSSEWEFPLLLKKRFSGVGPVRPFVDAGVNVNKISGLSQSVSNLVFSNRLT